MHRAKHRAVGRASADVLATTLIERFAVGSDGRSGPTRHAGTATLPDGPCEARSLDGEALFGAARDTAPLRIVSADDVEPAARDAAPLFGGVDDDVVPTIGRTPASPLFGAARHAARSRGAGAAPSGGTTAPQVPAPRVPALPFSAPSLPSVRVRPQPVGAAISATVLGAAAAVTAVVAPPSAIESTTPLSPVQRPAPAPAPAGLAAPVVPAPVVVPEQPTVRGVDLASGAAAEMEKVSRPYVTVASSKSLSAPAALRRAALSNALSKVGKPYKWGAAGPNAFDCSGLVKWSFQTAGRALPRTSRAMAGVGTPVSRANLQAGDLVFFYKPISHVGIYIGNGKVVHASRKGQPVKVSELKRMGRFSAARRV
jgi:cell wall-associated NlpC family hydrolase